MDEVSLSAWDLKRGQIPRRWRQLGMVALSVLLFGLSGCEDPDAPAPDPRAVQAAYRGRPRLEGSAEVMLQIRTAKAGPGTLRITLEGDHAPLTAGHFADLVSQGFYDGLQFFRVEKDPEPFVIHAGHGESGSVQELSGPPPLTIPLEIQLKGEPHPRYNTPLESPTLSEDLALPHRLGAVAMARSSAPDSASSQFYISLSALPILDGRFAVFGYVTEGMPLVDQIEVGDVIESAWIESGRDHLIYPDPDLEMGSPSASPLPRE